MSAMARLCGSRIPSEQVIGQHVFLHGCVCIPDEDGRPDLLIPDAARGVVQGYSTSRYAWVCFPLYERTTSVLWSRLIPTELRWQHRGDPTPRRQHYVPPQLLPYQRAVLDSLAV